MAGTMGGRGHADLDILQLRTLCYSPVESGELITTRNIGSIQDQVLQTHGKRQFTRYTGRRILTRDKCLVTREASSSFENWRLFGISSGRVWSGKW